MSEHKFFENLKQDAKEIEEFEHAIEGFAYHQKNIFVSIRELEYDCTKAKDYLSQILDYRKKNLGG